MTVDPPGWIDPPPALTLTGAERFRGVDATVTEFWAYALRDLRTNTTRGFVVEFLVARAVAATAPRVEWGLV
ncbi:hypothetical protein [Kribbella sp. VKM Ac-2566]|uniref:hypothetical protein n=1 Tax=Kribbella sp. VKM Ac-2566 TaxID=2512218 RepID=UPI0010629248|nr:hypothetical protein [Kribbella sp. VKM Ac-2566]